MNAAHAQAHGKVVLMGEYAVLEGAPALAAATHQQAHATFTPASADAALAGGDGEPRLHLLAPQMDAQTSLSVVAPSFANVPSALALLASAVQLVVGGPSEAAESAEVTTRALPAGTLRVDTSAFFRGGQKLGLGSSAAVLVAANRALAAAAGVPVASVERLIEAHRRWQGGQGSGVDVATCAAGGVVRFQLPGRSGSASAAGQVAVHLDAARGPAWTAISVGRASSTANALAAAATLKRDHPATYWSHLEELAHLSDAACEFWALDERVAFLPLVERAGQVLASFGLSMGLDVVTREHRDVAERVRGVSGTYKISGAGGGDIGVAFFVDKKARRALARALRGTPFAVVAQSN